MKELIDVDLIQQQIISFARGKYSKRYPVSNERSSSDSIIEGINMLGEELEATTISRDYFESIYNAVSDILIVTDEHFVAIKANKTACEKLKISENELIGMDPRSFIKIQPKSININSDENKEESTPFETVVSPRVGEEIIIRCVVNKLITKTNQFSGYLIIGTDITLEKHLEQKNLNLILTTQEKERERLAHDLHDSLGQDLNAILMYLQSINLIEKNSKQYTNSYNECFQLLEKTIESVRELSFDLMPKALEEKNLGLALIELFKRTRRFKIIEHNFLDEKSGLSKNTEKVIYRVFQEFITNSIRHAPLAEMEFSIFKSNKKLHFELFDNGSGFDLKKLDRVNGIININNRLEAIGAEHEWNTSNGTKLVFNLSYEKD